MLGSWSAKYCQGLKRCERISIKIKTARSYEDVSDVSLFSQEESSGLLRARCRILRDNIEGAKLRFVDLKDPKVCKRTSYHKGSMKKER